MAGLKQSSQDCAVQQRTADRTRRRGSGPRDAGQRPSRLCRAATPARSPGPGGAALSLGQGPDAALPRADLGAAGPAAPRPRARRRGRHARCRGQAGLPQAVVPRPDAPHVRDPAGCPRLTRHLRRVRSARRGGLRPARLAAARPQGAAPADPAGHRAAALRRSHPGTGRGPAPAGGRARARGRGREEGDLDLPLDPFPRLAEDEVGSRGRLRDLRLHAAQAVAQRHRRAAPVRVGRRSLDVGRQGRLRVRRQAAGRDQEHARREADMEAELPSPGGEQRRALDRARHGGPGPVPRVAGGLVAPVPGVRPAASRQAAARVRDAAASHRRAPARRRRERCGSRVRGARPGGVAGHRPAAEGAARSRARGRRRGAGARAPPDPPPQGVLARGEHHEGRARRLLPHGRATHAAVPRRSPDGC